MDGANYSWAGVNKRINSQLPARVARRERTRLVDGDDAVRTLVAMAATDDRRIVGWSYFDRARMGRA